MRAGYNVVWGPLSAAARARFDAAAAFAFFKQHENLNYGYGALLVGWVDDASARPKGNLPCLPPGNGEDGGASWCAPLPALAPPAQDTARAGTRHAAQRASRLPRTQVPDMGACRDPLPAGGEAGQVDSGAGPPRESLAWLSRAGR